MPSTQPTSQSTHYTRHSGNDNLWAGLIKSLYTAVEEHYGSEYAYAQRRAELIWGTIKLAFSFVLMAYVVTFYRDEVDIEDFEDITSFGKNSSSAEVTSAMGGIFAVFTILQTIFTLVVTPVSESKRIVKEASSTSFRKKLGYMAEIKSNLAQVGEYLDDPETVPTFLNFLLPKYIFTKERLKWINKKWRGGQKRRKCRLVIFIDDLDRCPPEKCVEVLQVRGDLRKKSYEAVSLTRRCSWCRASCF